MGKIIDDIATALSAFIDAAEDGTFPSQELIDAAKLVLAKHRKRPIPATVEEQEQFDTFRRLYKSVGTVNGNLVELKNFERHKDWREVLPRLLDEFERQLNEREKMREHGRFVPPWRNLRTWINQRGWETVYFANEETFDLPPAYLNWLRQFAHNRPLSEVVKHAMTRQEYDDYVFKSGAFSGLDRTWGPDKARAKMVSLHTEYFGNSWHRTKHPTVTSFILSELKKEA